MNKNIKIKIYKMLIVCYNKTNKQLKDKLKNNKIIFKFYQALICKTFKLIQHFKCKTNFSFLINYYKINYKIIKTFYKNNLHYNNYKISVS